MSTFFSHFSKINSGSVIYSKTSSSSLIEVDTIGFPKVSMIDRTMLLSGILIPTVFFFLNTLGKVLLPGNIKV